MWCAGSCQHSHGSYSSSVYLFVLFERLFVFLFFAFYECLLFVLGVVHKLRNHSRDPPNVTLYSFSFSLLGCVGCIDIPGLCFCFLPFRKVLPLL